MFHYFQFCLQFQIILFYFFQNLTITKLQGLEISCLTQPLTVSLPPSKVWTVTETLLGPSLWPV